MKTVDKMLQICCTRGFHVVKFYCYKKSETAVVAQRVKHYPIAKVSYWNAGEYSQRVERNNRAF